MQGYVRQDGLKHAGKEIDEDEVKRVIRHELEHALGQDGGTFSQERKKAIEYYEGLPLGTEVDGRSTVVMRSVLEAVEWVLPALIRIFTASDKICVVDPPTPDQEQNAQIATDYLTVIFYRDNEGFLILHDWMKDALLEKLGWVKYWWDTQYSSEVKTYSGLVREQYDALLAQAGPGGAYGDQDGSDQDEDADDRITKVETIEEESYEQEPGGWGLDRAIPAAPQPTMLWDVTLRITKQRRRVRIENVPPEEILFSRRAKRGTIPFLAHRRMWTYSDLIEQDYDEDCLDEIVKNDEQAWNSERISRHRLDQENPDLERDDAARDVWVEENYVRLDLHDTGTTELYKVVTANGGAVILTKDGKPDIECIDEVPFVSLCPVPMPHRLIGMSLADLTMDLQLIKSTLFRQMLDNAYLTNWPRIIVGDDVVNENTYDDLMTHRPGGALRVKRLGGIEPMSVPYTADKTFPLMEYIDQTQEVRTGVARHNQGINPDDLNKTATGIGLLQNAAAQRVELFARIFASGVENLMRGVMRLVRRHQQQERIVRLTGGFLPVDPRTWHDEMQVSVSVGLGTGNRDQILQQLSAVLQAQQTIVQGQQGMDGPLVYGKNIYDALTKMTRNAGFKEEFFHDPTKPPDPSMMGPPKPPQSDPQQQQAQAIVQATQIKAQAAVQAVSMKAQADTQRSQQKAQVEAQLQQQRAQLDAQLQQQRLDHEIEMEKQQTLHKMFLEKQEAEHKQELQLQEMQAKVALAQREVELKAAAGAYDPRPATNGTMVP